MRPTGFTLVEILIVVVILGVLAAIVIPQLSNAGSEAQLSRLCSDIQVVRLAIELYKAQHNDTLPGATTGVTFQQAMLSKSNSDGSLNPNGTYGPYIQRMPTNPFNKLDTVDIDAGDCELGNGNCGWHFNTLRGLFSADTDQHTDL